MSDDPPPGVHHASDIALNVASSTMEALVKEGSITVAGDEAAWAVETAIGGVFLTGLEMGLRAAILAKVAPVKRLLDQLLTEVPYPDEPPMELRERRMGEDVDLILEVAVIENFGGKQMCPDCGGEPLFDEATRHLVCGGCGQLLRLE